MAKPNLLPDGDGGSYGRFIQLHQYQLSSIPQELWPVLFEKLSGEIFDFGAKVELFKGESTQQDFSLHVKSGQELTPLE